MTALEQKLLNELENLENARFEEREILIKNQMLILEQLTLLTKRSKEVAEMQQNLLQILSKISTD